MNFLNMLAMKFMQLKSKMLADPSEEPNVENWEWVGKLCGALKNVLGPILAVVSAAGAIYAVVIAIQMAKADSGEKREEAKKRLISVIVAVVVLVVLVLFFMWLLPLILEQTLGITIEGFTASKK